MRTTPLIVLACAVLSLPVVLAPNVAADPDPFVIFSDPAVPPQVDALADGALDVGCNVSHWGLHGYIAISGWGVFRADGGYSDGCGGKGCDDLASGTYYTKSGASYSYTITENRQADGCHVECWYASQHVPDLHGGVQPDVPAPYGVVFSCGHNTSPDYKEPWVFSGCLESQGTYCEEKFGVSSDTGVQWDWLSSLA